MNRDAPMGVSMVKLVHTLAKQAEAMEAFKLARFAYGKLQGLKVRPHRLAPLSCASLAGLLSCAGTHVCWCP